MAEEAREAGKIEAAATVSWRGWGGEVTGGSGVLKVATATQVELGGPGQATNPEELLAAALANCYTSTITARARARKIDLAHVETRARTRLAWDATTPHHIAEGALSVRIRSRRRSKRSSTSPARPAITAPSATCSAPRRR